MGVIGFGVIADRCAILGILNFNLKKADLKSQEDAKRLTLHYGLGG